MASTFAIGRAVTQERNRVEARARFENGVVVGEDEVRAAELGKLHELPSLGETLDGWMTQIGLDECEDYAVDFRDVLLAADGRLDMGHVNRKLAEAYGTEINPGGAVTPNHPLLPMSYRTFGNVLRHYCPVRRNAAANLIMLPRAQDPHVHTGRTMRAGVAPLANPNWSGALPDSPRATAYNAYLDMKKRSDQTVTSLTGEPATPVIFRSRKLRRYDEKGNLASAPRVIIGVVSPTHCLRDGDDDKLIAAITLAFAGSVNSARAAAYRGVEESELRAVFPALTVSMPDAGEEKWSGYITARNSESGAKSWSVSAGLYRPGDGASIACEAIVRTGRHVGSKVAQRMVEVAEGAAALLKELAEKAAELGALKWVGTEAALLKQLRAALNGTPLFDADACCGLAWALGDAVPSGPVTVGALVNVLGRAAGALERRVDARPVEVMLGRTLVGGWADFHAAGTETTEDGASEE